MKFVFIQFFFSPNHFCCPCQRREENVVSIFRSRFLPHTVSFGMFIHMRSCVSVTSTGRTCTCTVMCVSWLCVRLPGVRDGCVYVKQCVCVYFCVSVCLGCVCVCVCVC